jgi:hypothetical protein
MPVHHSIEYFAEASVEIAGGLYHFLSVIKNAATHQIQAGLTLRASRL